MMTYCDTVLVCHFEQYFQRVKRQGGQGHVKAQVMNLYRKKKDLLKFCVHPFFFPLHARTTRRFWTLNADAGGREMFSLFIGDNTNSHVRQTRVMSREPVQVKHTFHRRK